jgi:Cu(I)/Ag(I) efflux system membrane fusion protein
MKRSTTLLLGAVAAAAVLAGTGYGMYQLGLRQQEKPPAQGPEQAAGGKKVLYWHDPMVPGQRFDKPGKSPFMDMQLVPVYADEGGESKGENNGVRIDPRVQQNLGLRLAEVKSASLAPAVQAVGSVAYDERALVLVQARSSGYVEKLYVRATLDRVKRGQPLLQLYVPDWVAAQEEFLAARRMQAAGVQGLADAARQRMRLAGMDEAQIRQVEASGKLQAHITLTAPADGVVSELTAREGMTVTVGAPLLRINGTGQVWILADIPESQAALLHPGSMVEGRAAALPGAVLKGRVEALLPQVDAATRTLKARVALPNTDGRLAPGMFVSLSLAAPAQVEILQIPSEAIIATGERSLVMLAQGEGRYAPVEVEPGIESGGMTEIRKGLRAGQQVVVSGQFLLDSEASLKGAARRSENQGQGDGK